MAYEYKRNRNKGASEITSPKFTYTRDLQKRKEYEKQQADYERRLLEEQKKFEEQHKNATSYNAWKEKTLGKTVDAEALWNSAIDISQKNNIIDRNTPTQADTSVLEEIEQLASQRKNVLNPFGTESIEDKLKKKTVTEDVEQLPEALKVALDKGYSNNLDPLKSKNAVTETKPRGEFDAGKQQVSQQLLTAIKTAKKKTENKYRLYNGVLYDLEELRREGKTISVIADDQKEYDQAVKDYAELEAYYNQITAESGLPLELEEKYKKYIGGNQTDTYEFIRKLQSSEQMANDVGSDITRGILNPQYSRDDFGDAWGYLFDTSSSEYNSVYMNTNERYAYFNILKNEGVESADAFYAKLEPYLLSRRNVDTERQANEVVQEANGLERTIMTLTEALSVVLAPIDYGLKAYGELTDQSFGLNHGLSVLEMQTNAISEDIAQDSKFWSWMYQLGLSAGKSAISLASGAPTLLMGADAASSTIDAAKKRGLSKEQTLLYGTLLGLIEGFTEQIGIEALFSDTTNLLKYLFTNIAAEGLEEGLANILGTAADVAVNKDEAEIIVSYENYIQEGFSEEEAKRKALLDFIAELSVDVLGGGITGGFFAGGAIGGHLVSNAIGNKLNTSNAISLDGSALSKGENAQADIQTLIDNANKSGDKKLQKAANKVAKTEKDGSYTASDKKLGKLVRLSEENRQQLIDDSVKYDNATKTDAIKKLEEGGFDTETAEKTFKTLMRDIAKGQVSTELAQAMGKNKAIRPLYESLSDYYSEEAVIKRVVDVAKASPVTEISNRIVDQRLKDAGIEVIDEATVKKDDVVDVDHVDEDGIAYVKTESGKVIPYKSDSLSISSASHKKMGYASLFGTNGAKTYFALAPETESSRYMNDFTNLYNMGARGESFSIIESNISEDVQKAIYEAGKADRDAAIKSRQKAETEAKEKEATFVKKQMGFKSDRVTLSEEAVAKIKSVSDKGISDQYKAAVKVIDGLAKMLQVNINIVASETDANGNYIGARGMYNRATNTFTFDIMSGMDNVAVISYSAMIKTAGHELTHFIQNWSPSKYLTLKNTTLKFLKDQNDAAWITKRLDEIRSDNEAIGKKLTLEQAKDELVADAFEDVLGNIDFAETILRTDKTLFDKIHSWVKKNVNDFKKNLGIAVKDVEAISDAAKEMRKAGERAQALYNQWADAFSTALENSTSGQTDVDQESSSVKENISDTQAQARKKTRFDVSTRLDLIETAKKNKIASDAASKGLILEYQRNLRSYQAAETTWRIARYHKDTDAIVAAATAMQLRRNTIASIECTKGFAELFGKLDIPYLVEETSAENGLSETALQNAKDAVRRARQELSEAERDAIEWARRIDVAGQRVYDASMRRMRLENSQALNSVQNRIKQAMDKPNTRSSIPVGGKPLAEAIMRTAKELNKLMSSKSKFSPEAETIALIKEAAVIGSGGDVRTRSVNTQDSINIVDEFGSRFKAEFKALTELYGNTKESKNLSFMYDEEVYMNLDQYSADKPDYDDVWSYIFDCARLVRAVAYDLTNANTIMVNKRAESYLELRGGLEYDFMHYAPKKMRKALANAASSITLTPEVFLHAIFGHTESANKFYQIYDDGQNKYIDVVLAARGLLAEIEEMTDKNGKKLYGEANKKKLLSNEATIDLHMYDGDGNKVLTNEDHAISFILAAKNADYRRHIMYGGWAIPDLEKANKGKNAYLDGRTTEHILDGENDNGEIIEYVTVERGGKQVQMPRIDFTMIDNMRAEANRFQAIGEIDKAIDLRYKLALANQEIKKIESDWEKKILESAGLAERQLSSYANACMQKLDIFYNNVAKAFLDEATEERYGFKKTLEKNHYYPIQVVKEQATQAELNTLVKQDYRVSALGSMKRRVRSKISCKLYGAVSSFAYNVENTAKYYGYLNTLNYIKKITGVSYDKMTDAKGKKKQTKEDIVTLGSYINRNLGNTVFTDYLYTLESDISGGKGMTTAADKALDFIYSGFVANALFFNISPTAKQLSALLLVYPDAGLSASIKGIIKGATTKGDAKGKTKFPMGLTEAQKRYVARYSRIYKYRSGGLVDADLSDFKQSNHPIARVMSKYPTLTGTNWMERADSQVLGLQFYAILESVKKSNPNLSAQEAATKAGEILDKTIQHFQANSTVLQRAPLLRSKGSIGMSLARVTVGTFKSQQLTMLNAKIDSLLKVATLENQIKELEKSNKREDAEKLKSLKSELSRSKKYAARVAAATMVSYIVNAAFTVAIQLLYKRVDDDDELWEIYGWDLLQSYMSIVPGVGDAIYYLIEQLTDNGYYGDSFAEVGLLGVINDVLDVIGSIGDGEYTIDRVAKDIGKLVAPFGVAARNVWNIVKAIFKWVGVEIE